ncbi:hypothetical protein FGO68_gene544 [Halteria grandinella]|uniref:Uncharacterized protein n=1 Tax=Halteria grandinella TaxID=5974 RepID=A0A8J8ND00_HALGN|nr:hypothetical protein FGO68_gene544 [Halteria grandinella]
MRSSNKKYRQQNMTFRIFSFCLQLLKRFRNKSQFANNSSKTNQTSSFPFSTSPLMTMFLNQTIQDNRNQQSMFLKMDGSGHSQNSMLMLILIKQLFGLNSKEQREEVNGPHCSKEYTMVK